MSGCETPKTNIYVIKCTNNKYYVGASKNVDQRYQQHLNGDGSKWTKLNKPIKLLEVKNNVSVFQEDLITIEYMFKYGIENVRGGSYSQLILNKNELIYKIRGCLQVCTRCCSKEHFVKQCNKIYCGPTNIELYGFDYKPDSDNSSVRPQILPEVEQKSLLGKRKEREEDIPEKDLPEEESVQEPPNKKAKNDDKNNHS